jgi:D-sedoheptulose 7-phosphate isomerase
MIETGQLIHRYPVLRECLDDIERAAELIATALEQGGALFICGNGGSCADADHIAGELLKSFRRRRPLPSAIETRLRAPDNETSRYLATALHGGLKAISLCGSGAAATAITNDLGADLVFAQQLIALGRPGDALLGISTSGNSANVVYAVETARRLGLSVVVLTGSSGGTLGPLADAAIRVPANETAAVQELHLPVYHSICTILENRFFPVPHDRYDLQNAR